MPYTALITMDPLTLQFSDSKLEHDFVEHRFLETYRFYVTLCVTFIAYQCLIALLFPESLPGFIPRVSTYSLLLLMRIGLSFVPDIQEARRLTGLWSIVSLAAGWCVTLWCKYYLAMPPHVSMTAIASNGFSNLGPGFVVSVSMVPPHARWFACLTVDHATEGSAKAEFGGHGCPARTPQ